MFTSLRSRYCDLIQYRFSTTSFPLHYYTADQREAFATYAFTTAFTRRLEVDFDYDCNYTYDFESASDSGIDCDLRSVSGDELVDLDKMVVPGAIGAGYAVSSASSPSLRSRESVIVASPRTSTPDLGAGNVRVVVRCRAFLKRGMFVCR